MLFNIKGSNRITYPKIKSYKIFNIITISYYYKYHYSTVEDYIFYFMIWLLGGGGG